MLTLSFATDNEAFRMEGGTELDFDEVARVLESVAHKVRAGSLSAAILDWNGNTVGRWELEDR